MTQSSPAPIQLITISREFGAGGSELASALGQRLGWRVLDRDLIARLAERLQLNEDVVERLDERPPARLARLTAALLIAIPENPVPVDPISALDLDHIAAAVRSLIEEQVQELPLIVVGHGTQALFHDRPDAFHVRVVAPIPSRLDRLCARYGWDMAHAEAQLHQLDRARRDYVQRYYHQRIDDALLYDLQINSGRISIPAAAALIAQAVEERGGVGLG